MAGPQDLQVIGEKTLHQKASPSLLAYCQPLDLVAVGSKDQQVLVLRLNGQRVYGAVQKGGAVKVEQVRWKPNGQLLAIAWSDGVVRLVGSESSKMVHRIPVSDASSITCIGWGSSLSGKRRDFLFEDKEKLRNREPGRISSISKEDMPDLPRDLALLDIESMIPKLSTLPASGTADDIFSSRASLDGLFRALDPKDDEIVDVLIAGTEDGQLHLSIYDSFIIGSFSAPISSSSGPPPRLLLHAWHQRYSTHSLLFRSGHPLAATLSFVPMDLRFISASSDHLSLLASRSTSLQNLLRYISQVQGLMMTEWRSTRDLPSRFLANINETLAEKNRDIVQAMYHSVATGHTFPEMKEWLVDELQERGHKRWEKAVVSSLENLRKLLHQNMLPALDRCTVILSRLNGLAQYQGSNDSLGYSTRHIMLLNDTISCLKLISTKILWCVVNELDLFITFSAWLRYEIDRLASDSLPSDELSEKEALIDRSKVLRYIQGSMMESHLSAYLREWTDEELSVWNQQEPWKPMIDDLTKQIFKMEDSTKPDPSIPSAGLLCKQLNRQAQTVFDLIAEAEKRNVYFGKALELPYPGKDRPIAMKVNTVDGSRCTIFIATAPESTSLHLFRLLLNIENGISSVITKEVSTIALGDGKMDDIAFLDDTTLLTLWSCGDDQPQLLSIPYTDQNYTSYQTPRAVGDSPTRFSNDEVASSFVKYVLPPTENFIPHKLEVSGTDGDHDRHDIRLCVLSRDRLHYKVYKLPNSRETIEQRRSDGDITMSQ